MILQFNWSLKFLSFKQLNFILQVTTPNLIDFDNFPEGFETVTDRSQLANGTFDLLSVDKLLETVWFPFIYFLYSFTLHKNIENE